MAFHDDPQGHTDPTVGQWYCHSYAGCPTHWLLVQTRTVHGLCTVHLWPGHHTTVMTVTSISWWRASLSPY